MSFFCEAQCKIVQHTHFLIADCIGRQGTAVRHVCLSIYPFVYTVGFEPTELLS